MPLNLETRRAADCDRVAASSVIIIRCSRFTMQVNLGFSSNGTGLLGKDCRT